MSPILDMVSLSSSETDEEEETETVFGLDCGTKKNMWLSELFLTSQTVNGGRGERKADEGKGSYSVG